MKGICELFMDPFLFLLKAVFKYKTTKYIQEVVNKIKNINISCVFYGIEYNSC